MTWINEFGGVVILAIIVLCAYIFFSMIIVSVNHVVLCHTFGNKFTRILKAGFNIIPPLEWASSFNWSYLDQEYVQQIDIAPTECETANGVTLSIDTLIVYNVSDPQKAIYVTDDPLNLLCQQVSKYIRAEVQKYESANVKRFESDICAYVSAQIKEQWTPKYGLELASCEIQSVSADDDTIRRRRQLRDGFSARDLVQIERNKMLGQNKVLVGVQ
jgi:regulator of protease activity HflC (stomatin/prohibitin superfamily)